MGKVIFVFRQSSLSDRELELKLKAEFDAIREMNFGGLGAVSYGILYLQASKKEKRNKESA